MSVTTNPFANYTLSIATQYQQTKKCLQETQKKPSRKMYRTMDAMLQECVFLGATRFGTNYIA